MKNKFRQLSVAVFIFILLVCTGCDVETQAYKAAELENKVSSFDNFLEKYPNGKNSINAKEKLRTLLITNLDPDWIVAIDDKFTDNEGNIIDNKLISADKVRFTGAWYGKSNHYTRDIDSGIIDWIVPRPEEQKIVLLILKDFGLPEALQVSKAYLWRGGQDFIFIKDINIDLEIEVLLKEFGMKYPGFELHKGFPL